MAQPGKRDNLKTALVTAGIAVFFFVMFFIKRMWLT